METDYMQIMIESLEKKVQVLNQIVELNRQQKFLLQDPNLSPDDFEKNMQYKSNLVEQLNLLDDGFEEVYTRVRDSLNANKEQYATEIARMQELIKEISALVNTVQIQEIKNKEEATGKFSLVRKQVRGVRNSQKVVKQYYDNMVGRRNTATQIIDDKQ